MFLETTKTKDNVSRIEGVLAVEIIDEDNSNLYICDSCKY